jgi:hypothetical protein
MSVTKRFGVTSRGVEFEWADVDEDRNETVHTFRAKPFMTFEQQLDWSTQRSLLNTRSLHDLRRRQAELKGIEDSDPDAIAKIEKAAMASVEDETARWELLVDLTLSLIDDRDVDTLRPMLLRADLHAVQALREWLEQVVFEREAAAVEAAANVDPTSPEPPAPSAPTPRSGPDSTPTDPPSTD